ncbi:Lrp/AsnC family transcriptional regulator [Schlegelella sp. S2-27]|uniref:Lrp/AsnC family transcriptional regulator n=1 Tax=Caldimonas mangrovi TaxID=2944811 RepID=A0ABT0YKB0_9BURK|nr:Lrp/AsnC family transcriptional regulator [Caldimonas mangrovi]MCM5678647.1 Lrp/AsnC family transcriptional regulator [Caldimonas mangrovi]
MTPDLDDLDRRILARYQHDTRIAAEAIGADIGLSAAAVQRRLKRLREAGVIRAETAALDRKALGLQLTAIVTVDLIDEGQAAIDRFRQRMCTLPQVQQCYATAGSVDYVLVLVLPDLPAYEGFARDHLQGDANVRSFTTHVVLEVAKTGNALPVSP